MMADPGAELLFDGAAEPLAGLLYGGMTFAILALMLGWKLVGRSLPWFMPIGVGVLGTFVTASTTWDQWRIRSMLKDGSGLQVTRGAIDQVWHIEERRRDMTKKELAYKTVISEGFDVGQARFSWMPGSCLSGAALCNLALIDPPLVKGMTVEVSWFKDSAQNDNNRVVRLRALPAPPIDPQGGPE